MLITDPIADMLTRIRNGIGDMHSVNPPNLELRSFLRFGHEVSLPIWSVPTRV